MISSATVPLPAMTAGSLTGWTKKPDSSGWPCSMMACHHSSKGRGTGTPPSRSMASTFVRGAVSGTTTRHATPSCRAAKATPWAMLPALAV